MEREKRKDPMNPSAYVLFACLLAIAFDITVSALFAIFMRIGTGQWTGNFLHVRVVHFVLALVYCSVISLFYGFAVLGPVDFNNPTPRRSMVFWSIKISLCVAAIGLLLIAIARGNIDWSFFALAGVILILFATAGSLTGYLIHGIGQAIHRRGMQ